MTAWLVSGPSQVPTKTVHLFESVLMAGADSGLHTSAVDLHQ